MQSLVSVARGVPFPGAASVPSEYEVLEYVDAMMLTYVAIHITQIRMMKTLIMNNYMTASSCVCY